MATPDYNADCFFAYVPLTKGQFAIVDAEDYDRLIGYAWSAAWDKTTNSYRAQRRLIDENGKGRTIFMHREVMNVELGDPIQVDHKDLNTLDNRKSMLRKATGSQNCCNKGLQDNNASGYKGVSWKEANKKWQAEIKCNGKRKYLGLHLTAEAAHEVYKIAAAEMHGEYARFA